MKINIKKTIVFFIISLLLEIFIFNFSTWRSLGYNELDLSDRMYCEGTSAYINDINLKINNIFIDANPIENMPITYRISMTDEGNSYEYPVGNGYVSLNSPSSYYRNIYSYGNVRNMEIIFDGEIQPNFEFLKVYINVKRPLYIKIWRIIITFLVMVFLSDVVKVEDITDKKKRFCIMGAVALIWIVIGYLLTSSHLLLNEPSKPHHQQYKELAVALSNGNVELPITPSESLVNADNPYDTIYLQANGIEYKADYAYYNGKYYVYFGIVPEILIYLPYYLLTGKDFPNHAAVFLFYAMFVISSFALIYEIVSTYNKKLRLSEYLIITSSLIACAPFAYIYFTADLYCVPLMAGIALTTTGLFLWMKAISMSNMKNKQAVLYCLGSLCMALVAGCRPQMLIFSFLAIPFFWNVVIKERNLFSKISIGRTLAFCVPYALVAAGIMYYNFARFGSVFDFGATYSLTNNDMNLRGISISRMLMGLWTFLFQMPNINGVFPYLHTVNLSFDYMGKIVSEHYFGGIIICNVFTWIIFAWFFKKNELKEVKLRVVTLMMIVGSLIIGLVDANQAGVLQRYSSDMSYGIILTSAILWIVIISKENENMLLKQLLKITFIMQLIYSFMIVFNVDSGITLIQYNPELFYKVSELFHF